MSINFLRFQSFNLIKGVTSTSQNSSFIMKNSIFYNLIWMIDVELIFLTIWEKISWIDNIFNNVSYDNSSIISVGTNRNLLVLQFSIEVLISYSEFKNFSTGSNLIRCYLCETITLEKLTIINIRLNSAVLDFSGLILLSVIDVKCGSSTFKNFLKWNNRDSGKIGNIDVSKLN